MQKKSIARLGVLALFAGAFAPSMEGSAKAAPAPFRSAHGLPSSNGRAAIVIDPKSTKLTQFLEHPYRFPGEGKGETRNFAYDAYPGVRVGTTGTWLPGVAPTTFEYVSGTGIVHLARTVSGVALDEYHFTPMGLAENVALTIVRAKRVSGTGPVDVYQLYNFRVGAGAPAPSPANEEASYAPTRDAFYEYGDSGIAFAYGTLGGGTTRHSVSPDNPYNALLGGSDLSNNAGTGGKRDDAAVGFQKSLGDLAVGAEGWAAFYAVLATDGDAQPAADRVRTWAGAKTPKELYDAEVAGWTSWLTPVPKGVNAFEAELAKASQVNLRMAQVTEPGKGAGQMLASLVPGRWNITWVRDMAYAVNGLIASGHLPEAKRAIDFQVGADVGVYESYVKKPYQISVVRYYGDGKEESDFNENGPNVEFDGFGLFLWTLDEYVKKKGSAADLEAAWPIIEAKVADVLVSLQEPSGLIAADSSIWEVHWNGKQRHFAYTTITAARGLCGAARIATALGKTAKAAEYLAAGKKARDALLTQVRAPDGALGQSPEGLAQGTKWLDAATLEAFGQGLLHPKRKTAQATIAQIQKGLVPPSGRGFMRSDIGEWYDSQEWVFVDLRAARVFDLAGRGAEREELFAWNVAQATENFGEISELHERTNASYVGESPMVGFGAGSYLIALHEKGLPPEPACGDFPETPEPGENEDGGVSSPDGGAVDPGGGSSGSGKKNGAGDDDAAGGGGDDGGCHAASVAPRHFAWTSLFASVTLAAGLVLRARRRKASR